MDLHSRGLGNDAAARGDQQPIGGGSHRHGKPASWLLVAVIVVAFVAGAFAVLDEAWPLFWVGLAVLVLSVPASRLIGTVRDAVLAGGPSGPPRRGGPITPAFGPALHPGVDVVPAPAVVAERPAVPS
ncbi:MAG TPA: HGxxPAAW family protein [Streptosporangiaceae bacterium]|jgi:hypothetical protein